MFSFEYCEIFKNIYCEEHLRTAAFYKPTSWHIFLFIRFESIKNESLRYFQWVYKQANGSEWIYTSLYKNKAIFVCVSVDKGLISKEKDVKNLKLFDLLSRTVFITLINNNFWLSFFTIFSLEHLENHVLSENFVW